MNSRPKISVVTVCRNEERSIEGTLQSVLQQTYLNLEYIVIDGQSTDRTREIIEKHLENIDYYVSEADAGTYDAMNKAIKHSNGDYLFFLNGGDKLYSDDSLQLLIENSKGEDIIYGDLVVEHPDGNDIRVHHSSHTSYLKFVTGTIPHPASMVKRILFDKFGLFDLAYRISADYEFFLRVCFQPGVSTQHVPVIVSVFNEEGMSSNEEFFSLRQRERQTIQRKHLPRAYYMLARFRYFLMINRQNRFGRVSFRALNRLLKRFE
jgi:glycosyltransferase involved in cell wall biosynthesis